MIVMELSLAGLGVILLSRYPSKRLVAFAVASVSFLSALALGSTVLIVLGVGTLLYGVLEGVLELRMWMHRAFVSVISTAIVTAGLVQQDVYRIDTAELQQPQAIASDQSQLPSNANSQSLVQQQSQRHDNKLSRLVPVSSVSTKQLKVVPFKFKAEFTDLNRVLSGEAIQFHAETEDMLLAGTLRLAQPTETTGEAKITRSRTKKVASSLIAQVTCSMKEPRSPSGQ